MAEYADAEAVFTKLTTKLKEELKVPQVRSG